MNKIYRLVSQSLIDMWTVASKLAHGQKKAQSSVTMSAVAAVALAMPAMLIGAPAHATAYSARKIAKIGQTVPLSGDSVMTTGTQATDAALQTDGSKDVLNAGDVSVSTTGEPVDGVYANGHGRMMLNEEQLLRCARKLAAEVFPIDFSDQTYFL
ncbi:ESPR-type extended signal peptide-containing protein [Dyella japonica]|nr:ESPR-type extended signal peptide-containing protein [Dyella japonica]